MGNRVQGGAPTGTSCLRPIRTRPGKTPRPVATVVLYAARHGQTQARSASAGTFLRWRCGPGSPALALRACINATRVGYNSCLPIELDLVQVDLAAQPVHVIRVAGHFQASGQLVRVPHIDLE